MAKIKTQNNGNMNLSQKWYRRLLLSGSFVLFSVVLLIIGYATIAMWMFSIGGYLLIGSYSVENDIPIQGAKYILTGSFLLSFIILFFHALSPFFYKWLDNYISNHPSLCQQTKN